MEHSEQQKAPSTLLPALRNSLGLITAPAQKLVPFAALQTAFEDADWHKRIEAVFATSEYPDNISTELLVHALHDEDGLVRAAAVHVWGKRKEGVPLVRLVDALNDSEWLVREAAVLAFGDLDEPMIVREQLMVALDDDNIFVQQAAHSVLDSLPTHTAIETSAGFIPQLLDSARRRFMFVIHPRGDEMSQQTSDLEDVDSSVTIVDLEPLTPITPVHTTLSGRISHLPRLAMGGLALLVVLAIIASWLFLLSGLHLSRFGQNASPHASTVLFNSMAQMNSNSYYLPAWTNDNRYMSFVDAQGDVYVWDSVTGQVKKTITLHYARISPDPYATWYRLPGGKYIVSSNYTQNNNNNNTGNTLYQIWNVVTGQTVLPANIRVYGWSNDGTLAAFVDNNHDLEIWNVDTETRLLITSSTHFRNAIDITWSLDKQSIAVASLDGFVQILDTKTGTVLHSFKIQVQPMQGNEYGPPYYDTWSNDLRRVIIQLNNGGSTIPLQIWDAISGRKIATSSDYAASASSPVWFNDGARVLVQGANDVRIWDAVTGHTLLTFPNVGTPSYGLTALDLSPDNRLLLYNDNSTTIRVWDTLSGREIFTFRGHKANIVPNSITWSPNSTYVASIDEDGVLLVWNARTGALAFTYAFHHVSTNPIPSVLVVWSPNGKMLAGTNDWDVVTVLKTPWINN